MSRTQNSIKNIKFSLFFQAASILVAFLTRKVFVLVLTKEYLGLDGTFANILNMLSLAELGVGDAITFSLYKPLAEGDQSQIDSLMKLYKKTYWIIGIAIIGLGCGLTPFLPYIIHDLPQIPHITTIYLLFVLNTSLSYFFVYKQSLIMADQKQYIVSTYRYGLKMLMFLTQAVFLLITHKYFAYLLIQIATTLLENILLAHKANQLYPYLNHTPATPLDKEVKHTIVQNIKALVIHKVGGVVVFGTDNLLISFFCGVVKVGLYSNYLMVTNGLKSIYVLLFRSLIASIGNMGATEDAEHGRIVFNRIDFLGRWLFGFFAICLMTLFNPFIALWVGEDYLFSPDIVFWIVINFYVTGMRRAVLTFRDAYGLYWYDRYKPIFESVINLVVSILLTPYFGVAGILMGTFVSTMATCFWIEPLVLFRHGLKASARPYFKEYAISTFYSLITGIVVIKICSLIPDGGILLFVGKAFSCVILTNLLFALEYCKRSEFHYFLNLAKRMLQKRLK